MKRAGLRRPSRRESLNKSQSRMEKKKYQKFGTQLDADGFPYIISDGEPLRVTRCCGAAASADEFGITYCKSCYKAVDARFGMEPRLENRQ